MIKLEFATKRDINGNRYYIGVNFENKTFGFVRPHWYCREDIIEISKADRRRLIDRLIDAGFVEVEVAEV